MRNNLHYITLFLSIFFIFRSLFEFSTVTDLFNIFLINNIKNCDIYDTKMCEIE
jgi:hypothetical protein